MSLEPAYCLVLTAIPSPWNAAGAVQGLYCTPLLTVRLVHSLGAETEQAKAQVWGVGQGWVCPCSWAATEESSSPERDSARDPGLSVQDPAFAQLPGKAPLPCLGGLRDTKAQ